MAPTAIAIAPPPLKALPLPADVAVLTVGAAVVVVVGIETLGCGKPGESGLPLGACACASAAAGSTSPAVSSATRTTRIVLNAPTGCPSQASGCSIAGVSGASA